MLSVEDYKKAKEIIKEAKQRDCPFENERSFAYDLAIALLDEQILTDD